MKRYLIAALAISSSPAFAQTPVNAFTSYEECISALDDLLEERRRVTARMPMFDKAANRLPDVTSPRKADVSAATKAITDGYDLLSDAIGETCAKMRL